MKLFFPGLIVSLFLLSCNNSSEVDQNKDTTLTNSATTPSATNANQEAETYTPLDETTARLMIYTFLSDSHVDHTPAAEIQRIEIDPKVAKKLFDDHKGDRFRLYTAAYLEDDANASRRFTKTVLLQIKSGSTLTYYDIYAISKLTGVTPICPPPSGTCSLNLKATLEEVKQKLAE